MNPMTRHEAFADFNRARTRETIQKILNLLNPSRQELLSLREVRAVLNPKSERYMGMQVVHVDRIVGSEGRYRDFNKQFLPRHEHLRNRWARVDEAHISNIILPAIKLYEIGGIYFVRDGNHRVSVARSQGVERIDAEVVSLDSEIELEPNVTADELKTRVIAYEQRLFYRETRFDKVFPGYDLKFTATGRYDEVLSHIHGHKYYININYHEEIPFCDAMISWFNHVYMPVVEIVREDRLLSRFPGRTEADMYTWIVKHWHNLKGRDADVPLRTAATDFTKRFGKDFVTRVKEWIAARREHRRREKAIARGEIIDDE